MSERAWKPREREKKGPGAYPGSGRWDARGRRLLRGQMRPAPCHICGARDARDADHSAGCPLIPPLSKAELVWRARAIEAAWAEKHGAARGAAA